MPFSLLARHAGAAAIAVAFASSAIAAGGNGHSHGHSGDPGDFAAGEPARASEADRTIRITADEYRFEPKRITVRHGRTVRFVITNRGAHRHNFVIGTPAEQKAHAQEMERLAESGGTMEHHDPNAVTVAPGQSDTLTWRFKTDQKVRFACHLPGHYEAGMAGTVELN